MVRGYRPLQLGGLGPEQGNIVCNMQLVEERDERISIKVDRAVARLRCFYVFEQIAS
jgi:hypothetical protein